jgi:ribose/xylose/arabinose/galactoside ABC-type transport system permease subunit
MADNVRDLLVQAAPFAIIACGMTFVVLLGEIDISVGSLVGVLSAVLGTASSASHWNWPPLASAALVCVVGSVVGALNGLLVAYARVPSIIVTLGMLTLLKGVTQLVLGGVWITDLPAAVREFGTGRVIGVPAPVLVAALIVAVSAVVAVSTPVGRRVYAAGSNREAAHTRGIDVRRLTLLAFTLTGLLTGIATLVSVTQLGVIDAGLGQGWELFVVTCVVVGGVSITGGKGSIVGAVLGVMLLGIVRTVLIFLKLDEQAVYWERSVQGGFILVAVLADRLGGRRAVREATR